MDTVTKVVAFLVVLGVLGYGLVLTVSLSLLVVATAVWVRRTVPMVMIWMGLFVFLRTGGVTAAALVSSVAYATVFVATLVAYKRVSGKPWRFFLPSPALARAISA